MWGERRSPTIAIELPCGRPGPPVCINVVPFIAIGCDKGINLIEHSTARALDLLSQTPTLIIGETQTSLTQVSSSILLLSKEGGEFRCP